MLDKNSRGQTYIAGYLTMFTQIVYSTVIYIGTRQIPNYFYKDHTNISAEVTLILKNLVALIAPNKFATLF